MCRRISERRSATDQLVLVGRHRREHRLREDKGAELLRLEVEQRGRVLLLLDDVDPRLVLVHGVQDDLQEPAAQAAASACGPCSSHVTAEWTRPTVNSLDLDHFQHESRKE